MTTDEKKLEKWKSEIERSEVPVDRLDQAIHDGFNRATSTESTGKRKKHRRGILSIAVAAILLVTLITSIRVSPAFANAVASLPGMEAIVNLIKDNKGLQSAIKNEHYQTIGVSDQTSGVKVTLDGAIADEMNLVLFYTMEFKQNHKSDFRDRVQIKGANGEDLKWGGISYNDADDFHTSMKSINSLEIDFQEPLPTKDLVLEMEMIGGYGERETIEIPFTIEMSDVKSKTYVLNEEVTIEGQKLTFIDVVISPVRTAIQVEYDEDNTMVIFGFEDLEIVDGWGKGLSNIHNGTTASSSEDKPNRVTYYMQSNYFEEPKHLYLKFSKLMAMNKEEAYVLVDTDKMKIVKQPKEARFSNLNVQGNDLLMDFHGEKDFYHSPITFDFSDAKKETYTFASMSGGPNGEEDSTFVMELPEKEFQNPIKMEIQGYPSYINGHFKSKIK